MGKETIADATVNFKVEHAQATRSIGEMKEQMSRLSEATERTRERVRGVFEGTLAKVGLGLGVGELVKHTVELESELGGVNKQLAGTLYAFRGWQSGTTPIQAVAQSMRDASKITDELREQSSRLGIEYTTLASAFNVVGGPAMSQFGRNSSQALETTIHAAEVARVLGVDVSQVAEGMTRLMETRNLRGIDPFMNKMREVLGTTKNIRAMNPGALFEEMDRAMAKIGKAAPEMAQGLGGTMFRIKNFVDELLTDAGGPAFQYISGTLAGWQKHLRESAGDGRTVGQVLSDRVLAATKEIVKAVEFLASHWKEIAGTIVGLKIAGLAKDAWDFADGLGKALKSAKELREVSGAAGAIRGLLGGAGAAAGVAEGAGAGAAVAGGIGEGVAALGSLALAIAPVVAALGALYGVLKLYQDWKGMGAARTQAQVEVPQGIAALRGLYAAKDQDEARKAVSTLRGMGWVDDAGHAVAGLNFKLERVDDATRAELAKLVQVKGDISGMSTALQGAAVAQTVSDRLEKWARKAARMDMPAVFAKDVIADSATKDLSKPQHITNNTFNGGVHVTIDAHDEDPDNIWFGIKDGIEGEASKRTMGRNVELHGP